MRGREGTEIGAEIVIVIEIDAHIDEIGSRKMTIIKAWHLILTFRRRTQTILAQGKVDQMLMKMVMSFSGMVSNGFRDKDMSTHSKSK